MDITRHLKGHTWEIIPMSEVREAVIETRVSWGCKPLYSKLLTLPNEQTKFRKGDVPVCGVSMLPHTLAATWLGSASPGINMCPNSTPGCRQNCLVFSGRGNCSPVMAGRGWKTDLLKVHPNAWFTMFHHEIRAAAKRYDGLRVRPNVFSDVHWEKLLPDAFWAEFKNIRFMDYTKGWRRGTKEPLPKNYRLVYSASERTSLAQIRKYVIQWRQRVTVVFDVPKDKPLPKKWNGMRVVDGDVDDDLWSRPAGTIVGLRAKGRLRKADSGFKRKAS